MPSACCAKVRPGTLDESRLLPSAEKRARDVGKKLDRLAARQGWYTFMAGQAEVMAVEQVTRWRSEVSRFAARSRPCRPFCGEPTGSGRTVPKMASPLHRSGFNP